MRSCWTEILTDALSRLEEINYSGWRNFIPNLLVVLSSGGGVSSLGAFDGTPDYIAVYS